MNAEHWSPPGEWEQLRLGKEQLVWLGDVGMSRRCPRIPAGKGESPLGSSSLEVQTQLELQFQAARGGIRSWGCSCC